ncbi:MAG: NYN domain-containing protein [Methyloligellaceae bacterium]
MIRQSTECLSALFVDYDNIYLSLRRKNEEAARRFAKDTGSWLKEIETGGLITPSSSSEPEFKRRLVLNRCYGNPVPRRNGKDNATDMHSFPFVRHHFLRSGFEIMDCPPLTAQLKNSSDIRMVMDIRDLLEHETYFDEFIILSGDADFTPILHRLRSHARRTVIFANDYTAAPYTAISNGEIRETDLIHFLMEGNVSLKPEANNADAVAEGQDTAPTLDQIRKEIVDEVIRAIHESDKPVPIAFLADKAQKSIGHEKTVGTNWAGYGAFRIFLAENLPNNFELTETPPYYVLDPNRHQIPGGNTTQSSENLSVSQEPPRQEPPRQEPQRQEPPSLPTQNEPVAVHLKPEKPILQEPVVEAPQISQQDRGISLQDSISRIHQASKAPPLAPPDYALIFNLLAQELTENGLSGAQTINNIVTRAAQHQKMFRHEDIQFVLDAVSEADPWFEQGASAELFAGRFRNYVIAACRQAGLQFSLDELSLIDAWFVGKELNVPQQTLPAQQQENAPRADAPMLEQQSEPFVNIPQGQIPDTQTNVATADQNMWWDQPLPSPLESGGNTIPEPQQHEHGDASGLGNDLTSFPRIVRKRMSG